MGAKKESLETPSYTCRQCGHPYQVEDLRKGGMGAVRNETGERREKTSIKDHTYRRPAWKGDIFFQEGFVGKGGFCDKKRFGRAV